MEGCLPSCFIVCVLTVRFLMDGCCVLVVVRGHTGWVDVMCYHHWHVWLQDHSPRTHPLVNLLFNIQDVPHQN